MQISSNAPVATDREVPEKIRIWKEQQIEMLKQKEIDENLAIEKLKQSGKEELDNWIKTNLSNLEKIKINNRLNDSNHNKSDNDDDLKTNENNNDWNSIYKLCDFSQKVSRNEKDTQRMKSIFLQLKQNPLNKNA
jgi:hypothetical protein